MKVAIIWDAWALPLCVVRLHGDPECSWTVGIGPIFFCKLK